MTELSKIDLERKLEESEKEVEYYKRIAEQTGNIRLRESEASSKIILWRQQAEEELKSTHNQLREANKKLKIAYARMRDWKDQLSMALHGEETGLLIDKDGRILGITERVLTDCTGRNTTELLGSNILDLVEEEYRKGLKKSIKDADTGIFNQTPVRMVEKQLDTQRFTAKLINISMKGERLILVLMRRSD